jgi:hypothetical protein
MILSKYLKILELFILGFVFPVTIVMFRFSEYILLFLWLSYVDGFLLQLFYIFLLIICFPVNYF